MTYFNTVTVLAFTALMSLISTVTEPGARRTQFT